MGKKVSPILYRINKFNNYKNNWIFKYNKIFDKRILYDYILLSRIFVIENLYNKYKYTDLGLICCYKFYNKFYNKILHKYSTYNLNILFITIYKPYMYFASINFLKLFIKVNLYKNISIKYLYQKLKFYLLNNYLSFINIKIIISGCFHNTDMSKIELFKFGTLVLHNIDTNILYDKFFIITKYGIVGIKIWVENCV